MARVTAKKVKQPSASTRRGSRPNESNVGKASASKAVDPTPLTPPTESTSWTASASLGADYMGDVPGRLARLSSKEGALAVCALVLQAWAVHRFEFLPVWVPLEAFAIIMLAVAYLVYNWVRHRAPHTGYIAGNESMNLVTTPENRPTIHGFMLVEGKLTREEIIEEMKRAGVPDRRFKRFSCRVTRDWETGESFDPDSDWPAYFQEDPTFDLGNHVKYISAKNKNSGMSRDEMLAYLATVINKPPCLDRPPWEVLIAQNFDQSDVTAVIFRVHHVLADGLALVTFMDAITKPMPGDDEKTSSLAAAARVGLKFVSDCHVVIKLAMYLRLLVEFPLIMFKDYMLPSADRNVFKQPLTGRKKLGWSMNRLDMGRVKMVKGVHACKINDLFLSCATGTLRNLSLAHHTKHAGKDAEKHVPWEMKMYSPISVRDSLHQCDDLNNMLSVLLIPLPTRMQDPVKRLRHIEGMMNVKKRSIVPWGLAQIMGTMGAMPRAILSRQMAFLYNKVTAVLTNVPGPAHKRTIAGRTIEEMMFWVPGLGSIGVVLSIFTYGNKVSIGVVVDEGLPFAPNDFLEEFWKEFDHMEQLAEAAKVSGHSKRD